MSRLMECCAAAGCLGALAALGCSSGVEQPSEAQLRADAIVSEAFRGNDRAWFGVEDIGPRRCLVELHEPRVNLVLRRINEADRQAGVSDRVALAVGGKEMRIWDGNRWGAWKSGAGYWDVILEKRHGEWSARTVNQKHFEQNPSAVASVMAAAGLGG